MSLVLAEPKDLPPPPGERARQFKILRLYVSFLLFAIFLYVALGLLDGHDPADPTVRWLRKTILQRQPELPWAEWGAAVAHGAGAGATDRPERILVRMFLPQGLSGPGVDQEDLVELQDELNESFELSTVVYSEATSGQLQMVLTSAASTSADQPSSGDARGESSKDSNNASGHAGPSGTVETLKQQQQKQTQLRRILAEVTSTHTAAPALELLVMTAHSTKDACPTSKWTVGSGLFAWTQFCVGGDNHRLSTEVSQLLLTLAGTVSGSSSAPLPDDSRFRIQWTLANPPPPPQPQPVSSSEFGQQQLSPPQFVWGYLSPSSATTETSSAQPSTPSTTANVVPGLQHFFARISHLARIHSSHQVRFEATLPLTHQPTQKQQQHLSDNRATPSGDQPHIILKSPGDTSYSSTCVRLLPLSLLHGWPASQAEPDWLPASGTSSTAASGWSADGLHLLVYAHTALSNPINSQYLASSPLAASDQTTRTVTADTVKHHTTVPTAAEQCMSPTELSVFDDTSLECLDLIAGLRQAAQTSQQQQRQKQRKFTLSVTQPQELVLELNQTSGQSFLETLRGVGCLGQAVEWPGFGGLVILNVQESSSSSAVSSTEASLGPRFVPLEAEQLLPAVRILLAHIRSALLGLPASPIAVATGDNSSPTASMAPFSPPSIHLLPSIDAGITDWELLLLTRSRVLRTRRRIRDSLARVIAAVELGLLPVTPGVAEDLREAICAFQVSSASSNSSPCSSPSASSAISSPSKAKTQITADSPGTVDIHDEQQHHQQDQQGHQNMTHRPSWGWTPQQAASCRRVASPGLCQQLASTQHSLRLISRVLQAHHPDLEGLPVALGFPDGFRYAVFGPLFGPLAVAMLGTWLRLRKQI